MFSVRRDELTSPPSSPAPSSPALSTNDANERLGKLLGFEIPPLDIASTEASGQAVSNPDAVGAPAPEEEEQEFEFRLFSSAPTKQKTEASTATGVSAEKPGGENAERTQKLRIRIRSPTPGDVSVGEGRFVVPFRGWEYYFTTPTLLGGYGKEDVARAEERAAAKRAEFEDIAVSQTQLFEWAKQPWVCIFSYSSLLSFWIMAVVFPDLERSQESHIFLVQPTDSSTSPVVTSLGASSDSIVQRQNCLVLLPILPSSISLIRVSKHPQNHAKSQERSAGLFYASALQLQKQPNSRRQRNGTKETAKRKSREDRRRGSRKLQQQVQVEVRRPVAWLMEQGTLQIAVPTIKCSLYVATSELFYSCQRNA